MSSNPSTQDLIEAARALPMTHAPPKDASTGPEAFRDDCPRCLLFALADRLEEVEEERDRWREMYRRGKVRLLKAKVANLSNPNPEGGDADDRGPREHSPDPDVTQGESGVAVAGSPEPEDDPWDEIERYAAESPASRWDLTLLDLRKRVETGRRNGDSVARTVNAAWRQIAALEDRLTTLEGHADRGAEAKAELRGRIEELETEVAVARHMRLKLLERLSELADREGV